MPAKSNKAAWIGAGVLLLAVAAFAWSRVGMLNLPSVPGDITLDTAGLADLKEMKSLNDQIWSITPLAQDVPRSTLDAPTLLRSDALTSLPAAASLVQHGIAAYRRGDTTNALESMRQGIRLDPSNLVLAN